jgi:hypothetical protein
VLAIGASHAWRASIPPEREQIKRKFRSDNSAAMKDIAPFIVAFGSNSGVNKDHDPVSGRYESLWFTAYFGPSGA